MEVVLILVDMTHTSKGFKAKPDAVGEAHTPGPEREHKQVWITHDLWAVHQAAYQMVKKNKSSHPSQDPSGLCNFLQYSRPSFRVELKKEKFISRVHTVMWHARRVYGSVWYTLSLQHGVEGRPSGSVSGPASLLRCTPHRCNLSWCRLVVCKRRRAGSCYDNTT